MAIGMGFWNKYNPFKPENKAKSLQAFKRGNLFVLIVGLPTLLYLLRPERERNRMNLCEQEVDRLLKSKTNRLGVEDVNGQRRDRKELMRD